MNDTKLLELEKRFDDFVLGVVPKNDPLFYQTAKELKQLYMERCKRQYRVEIGIDVEWLHDTYIVTRIIPQGRAKPFLWGRDKHGNEVALSISWRHIE